jgi:hypothetical protein
MNDHSIGEQAMKAQVMKVTVAVGALLVRTTPAVAAPNTTAPAGTPPAKAAGTGLGALKPDPGAIPGGEQAKALLNGIMFYGLAVAAAALIASAGWMGWGKMRRNPAHVESGQTGVLWALGGAVLIGGAGAFISWAFKLGVAIHA